MNVEQVVRSLNARLQSPVAVLCGGLSSEREVSLKSGASCYEALLSAGIAVQLIDTRDDWISQLREGGFRHSFIALHGPGGEDGTIQGALECLGLSYTGSGVLASALAMDKWRSKLLWNELSLISPAARELNAESNWADIMVQLGGRVIVKPAHEGSSIGMSVAATPEELALAWQTASRFDSQVFAERWITGPEFTVAILADEALPVIGLQTDNTFYDFEAKYLSDQTRYLIPSGLDDEQNRRVQQLALAAYRSLGCGGWARVDLLQDADGAFQLLEVNTVPGMTDHSLVPMAAAAAGFDFTALVLKILATSLPADEEVAPA